VFITVCVVAAVRSNLEVLLKCQTLSDNLSALHLCSLIKSLPLWGNYCIGVHFPKASLANYGHKFSWTLLVMTELGSKRTPDKVKTLECCCGDGQMQKSVTNGQK